MESYVKMLDCLILREVIARLPFPDQLTARLVNKDWENEAYHVIRRSKKCVVKFFTSDQITNFIRVFPEPLPATSNFYSFATFDVKLMRIALDLIQRFAGVHGASVQSLQIHVTTGDGFCCLRTRSSAESSMRQANDQMHAKVKTFLTNFQNLVKLSVEEDHINRRPHLRFRERNAIPVAELQQFENLEHFDASVNTTIIPLLNEIVKKCPNLRTGNLTLKQYTTNRSAVREFFQRFGSVDLGRLEVVLNEEPEENRNYLLRELLRSDLQPKYLILEPQDMFEPKASMVARRNNFISEWIQKLTQSPRMTKLKLISWGPNIPLTLPSEMSYLTELDFGFTMWGCRLYTYHRPAIFEMTPLISQGQVPSLRKLVIGPHGNQLNPDQIFTNVQELVIDGHPELIEQLPSPLPVTLLTYDWSTKFPNVTKLDMVTGVDALLGPVLTNMLTLTDLKVTFQGLRLDRDRDDIIDEDIDNDDDGIHDNDVSSEDEIGENDHIVENDRTDDNEEVDGDDYNYRGPYVFSFNDDLVTVWWEEITGGIRPILNKDSSLEMILPSNLEQAETDLGRGDGPALPKLGNLCNLKTLKFANAPASIVLAVIHLTALKQIPQLDKIEILTSTYDAYEPSDACVNVLKTFHGQAEIKRYLVDDGFNNNRD